MRPSSLTSITLSSAQSSPNSTQTRTGSLTKLKLAGFLNAGRAEESNGLFRMMLAMNINPLDLSGLTINAKGVECLRKLLENDSGLFGKIPCLDLSGTRLGSATLLFEELAKQEGGNLESLNFSNTRVVRPEGEAPLQARHLESLAVLVAKNPKLKKLDISFQTQLGDPNSYYSPQGNSPKKCNSVMGTLMEAVRENPSLEEFNVSGCHLRASDLDAMSFSLGHLRCLNISNNPGLFQKFFLLIASGSPPCIPGPFLRTLILDADQVSVDPDLVVKSICYSLGYNHILQVIEPFSSSTDSRHDKINQLLSRNKILHDKEREAMLTGVLAIRSSFDAIPFKEDRFMPDNLPQELEHYIVERMRDATATMKSSNS